MWELYSLKKALLECQGQDTGYLQEGLAWKDPRGYADGKVFDYSEYPVEIEKESNMDAERLEQVVSKVVKEVLGDTDWRAQRERDADTAEGIFNPSGQYILADIAGGQGETITLGSHEVYPNPKAANDALSQGEVGSFNRVYELKEWSPPLWD